MWNALSDVERPLRCGTPSPMWNALSDVERPLRCGTPSPMWNAISDVERPLRCGTPSPIRNALSELSELRGLGELVVLLLIFLTIRPFYGYLRIPLGCDWSANDFHTQRCHGVNCFQHAQPSEYYKFKRVNRIRPTPSVCLSVSKS